MKKARLIFLTAALFLTAPGIAQYTIPPMFFAINGWMNEKSGDHSNVYNCPGLSITYSATPENCYPAGKADEMMEPPSPGCSTKIKDLHVNLVRFGGILHDKNPPTYEQYLNEIDLIRSMGFEPIIQIPNYNNTSTPTDAANLLTFLNVTKGKGIKYVSIGNEPNDYPLYAQQSGSQAKAEWVAGWFKSFASALKTVDANIKIIGPSFSFYDETVYGYFFDSNYPNAYLMGTDSDGYYYLDIADIHRYPFEGNSSHTRSNVIDDPADVSGTYQFKPFTEVLSEPGHTGLADRCSQQILVAPAHRFNFQCQS